MKDCKRHDARRVRHEDGLVNQLSSIRICPAYLDLSAGEPA